MKHTPGPWHLPHFAEPGGNCQCGYVLSEHQDGMGAIATVHASGEGNDWQSHGDNPKFEEAVANAHLIVASPDMLEALQLMDAYLYATAPESNERQIVQRAIAKATP